jgi:hypothetical protein
MGKRQRRRLREAASLEQSGDTAEPARGRGLEGATAHLAELIEERRRIELALDEEIERLRRAGLGWPAIARALSVTRQAARQRYQRSSDNALVLT